MLALWSSSSSSLSFLHACVRDIWLAIYFWVEVSESFSFHFIGTILFSSYYYCRGNHSLSSTQKSLSFSSQDMPWEEGQASRFPPPRPPPLPPSRLLIIYHGSCKTKIIKTQITQHTHTYTHKDSLFPTPFFPTDSHIPPIPSASLPPPSARPPCFKLSPAATTTTLPGPWA